MNNDLTTSSLLTVDSIPIEMKTHGKNKRETEITEMHVQWTGILIIIASHTADQMGFRE